MATITGTSGNDTITPGGVSAGVTGGVPSDSPDSIYGLDGNDIIDGGGGNDTINAGDGNNVVDGGDGNDSITTGAGNDTVLGGLGNDTIKTGSGADSASGGEGDDRIYISTAWTSLSGGAGYDQVYISGTTGNTLDLSTAGIEYLSAGDGNDNFDGSAQTVELTLDGNLGDDILRGSNFNDTIYGDDGNNTLYGNAGDDRLYGGSGNDTINAGSGNDTINAGDGNNLINGGDGNDSITTGAGNDTILGGLGNDSIHTGAGNDSLNGGNGNDLLDGGTGSDTASYAGATAAVTVNLGLTTAQNTGGAGIDTLISIENLTGSAYNDTLTGNSANNTLNGGGGIDILIGSLGNDTYIVDTTTDILTENLNEGTDTVRSSVTYTLGHNLENLTLTGTAAISGTGNSLNNVLHGNAANNTLDGGAGNDILFGAGGADTFVFNAGFGSDRVDDFTPGQDQLQLSTALGVSNFAGLDSNSNGVLDDADAAVSVAGDDTIIALGSNQIDIVGQTTLHDSDFAFV